MTIVFDDTIINISYSNNNKIITFVESTKKMREKVSIDDSIGFITAMSDLIEENIFECSIYTYYRGKSFEIHKNGDFVEENIDFILSDIVKIKKADKNENQTARKRN